MSIALGSSVHLKASVFKTMSMVSLSKEANVVLMVVHHDIRISPCMNQCHLPRQQLGRKVWASSDHKASRHIRRTQPARCLTPRNYTEGRSFRQLQRQHLPCLCQWSPRSTWSRTSMRATAPWLWHWNNLIQGDARPIWRRAGRTRGLTAPCISFCQRKDGMFIQSTCCVLRIQNQTPGFTFANGPAQWGV